MRNKIVALLTVIGLSACNQPELKTKPTHSDLDTIEVFTGTDLNAIYRVVIIDGCEYTMVCMN